MTTGVVPSEAADLPVGTSEPAVVTGEFTNGYGSRRYRLFLADSTNTRGRATMVVLHGCGQSGDELARLSKMDDAAQRAGFVVLYPEQSAAANPLRCWNWFVPENQRRDSGEPGILAGMIRKVVAAYGLDSMRVHIVGISAGGAMAGTLAATYPELVAGIALHSAVPHRSATTVQAGLAVMRGDLADTSAIAGFVAADMGARHRQIPALVIQGTTDAVVNVRNGEVVAAQWRRVNRSAPTEFLLIEGLGHLWSGGAPGERFAAPDKPDATARIVEFFTAHAALGNAARRHQA